MVAFKLRVLTGPGIGLFIDNGLAIKVDFGSLSAVINGGGRVSKADTRRSFFGEDGPAESRGSAAAVVVVAASV